jgi:hypothetical protein
MLAMRDEALSKMYQDWTGAGPMALQTYSIPRRSA